MTKTFAKLLELPANAENSDRQFVTALARGLEVLRAFEPHDGPLGNQELAQRTGLTKPTVSRITHTLTTLGYLEYLPRLSKYRPGLGVLALGFACIGGAALRGIARSHMQQLASTMDASVAIGGRDRLNMIYLEVCRSAHTAAFSLDAGARIPMHRSAMGYAYLWALPEKEREFLVQAMKKHFPSDWSSVRKRLESAFKSIDTQGFCVAEGTYERSINGVGVPLVLQGGTEVHGLSCSAPAFHFSAQRIREEVGPRLVAVAAAIRADAQRHTRTF